MTTGNRLGVNHRIYWAEIPTVPDRTRSSSRKNSRLSHSRTWCKRNASLHHHLDSSRVRLKCMGPCNQYKNQDTSSRNSEWRNKSVGHQWDPANGNHTSHYITSRARSMIVVEESIITEEVLVKSFICAHSPIPCFILLLWIGWVLKVNYKQSSYYKMYYQTAIHI